MNESDTEIIESTLRWMTEFVELPHPVFGDLPVCPFTKTARLVNQILFKIQRFSALTEFDRDSAIMQSIHEFYNSDFEIMLVINPEKTAISAPQTQALIEKLNHHISELSLLAFHVHPEEDFNIDGLYTRRMPYPGFTVQVNFQLKPVSDSLLKTEYYKNWTAQQLKYFGIPRN
ncbi:MAG TPA: hypothetical protein DD001_18385 [Microcoleaceae bacterium UBA10368]|jgi:hypothetical protein|nr:hypothetical protein [Microcoleaceae cyanobacterium UBA10368]HCV30692.1 hypothetical protein [Microcoleaceae cyanobacterium UBA9251]